MSLHEPKTTTATATADSVAMPLGAADVTSPNVSPSTGSAAGSAATAPVLDAIAAAGSASGSGEHHYFWETWHPKHRRWILVLSSLTTLFAYLNLVCPVLYVRTCLGLTFYSLMAATANAEFATAVKAHLITKAKTVPSVVADEARRSPPPVPSQWTSPITRAAAPTPPATAMATEASASGSDRRRFWQMWPSFHKWTVLGLCSFISVSVLLNLLYPVLRVRTCLVCAVFLAMSWIADAEATAKAGHTAEASTEVVTSTATSFHNISG